jgi:hypothetical protein
MRTVPFARRVEHVDIQEERVARTGPDLHYLAVDGLALDERAQRSNLETILSLTDDLQTLAVLSDSVDEQAVSRRRPRSRRLLRRWPTRRRESRRSPSSGT